jgi:hypothetical protein
MRNPFKKDYREKDRNEICEALWFLYELEKQPKSYDELPLAALRKMPLDKDYMKRPVCRICQANSISADAADEHGIFCIWCDPLSHWFSREADDRRKHLMKRLIEVSDL